MNMVNFNYKIISLRHVLLIDNEYHFEYVIIQYYVLPNLTDDIDKIAHFDVLL